ncbi:hypothetical protein YC2023_005066 [Brassica napus]
MFSSKFIMRKSYVNIGTWLESLYLYILTNFKFIVSSSASKSITKVIDQLIVIKSIIIVMVIIFIFNRYIEDILF